MTQYDVILQFGPLIQDKVLIPDDLLSKDHLILSPEEIFRSDPALGLRDIALRVVHGIKQKKQVVILGGFKSKSSRMSLIQTINKKISECRAVCVQVLPKYGLQQALWDLHLSAITSDCKNVAIERQVKQWFSSNQMDLDISVEVPTELEGYDIKEVKVPLSTTTYHKPTLPGLLLQGECVGDGDGPVCPAITSLAQQWSKRYSAGRILVLWTGRTGSGAEGLQQGSDKFYEMKRCMRCFAEKVACPVYALCSPTPSSSGSTQPALMACVYIRHLVALHSKATMYVFSTRDHMKVAEAAGIRHVQIGSVLKSTDMVLAGYGQTSCPPAMLQDICLVKPLESTSTTPQVPLFEAMQEESSSGYAQCKFPNGVEEHAFVRDKVSLRRYQECFASAVRTIDQPFSEMEDPSSSDSGQPSAHHASRKKLCNSPPSHRAGTKVRSWMVKRPKKESSEESIPSLKKEGSSSRCLKTVYIMSEKELTDMARQILKEAGQDVEKSFLGGDNG